MQYHLGKSLRVGMYYQAYFTNVETEAHRS